MAYTEKDWKDSPLTTTPLSAAAMEDLETRVTDYVEHYSPAVNVWESVADPESVTDWGPIINALIQADYKQLYFKPATEFPFSTQIDINEVGVQFKSGASYYWPSSYAEAAKLIWTGGAGSGTAIHVVSPYMSLEGIMFMWDDATYNAAEFLLAGTNSTIVGGSWITRCAFFPANTDCFNANLLGCWLHIPNATGWQIIDTDINSAQIGIKQFDDGGVWPGVGGTSEHPDDVDIINCNFGNNETACFMNIGKYTNIERCKFFMGSIEGEGRIAAIIDSDHTTPSLSIFNFTRNRIWDMHPDQAVLFKQRVNNPWRAQFLRSFVQGNVDGVVHYQLDGPGTISIAEDYTEGTWDVGQWVVDLGNPATAKKTYVYIRGNTWTASAVAAASELVKNIEGHDVDHIGGVNQYTSRSIQRVDKEVGRYMSNEAAHVGMASSNLNTDLLAIDVQGNDAGGVITSQVYPAQIDAGEKLCDLAFRFNDELPGTTRFNRRPSIVFSPTVFGLYTGVADVYASLTDGSQDGFALYARDNLAAGYYAWAYRVLQT